MAGVDDVEFVVHSDVSVVNNGSGICGLEVHGVEMGRFGV